MWTFPSSFVYQDLNVCNASGEHPIAKVVVAHAKKLRKKFGSFPEEVPYIKNKELSYITIR